MLMPITATNKPNHLPKMNPANNAKGVPNPAANTHKIENEIKIIPNKNKLDSLSS